MQTENGAHAITIGEIVAKNFRSAETFGKYGIDFCCGGKISLEEACRKKGINIKQIQEELDSISAQSGPISQDYNSWDLDFLCDYIVNTHHKYVVSAMPVIFEYTQKVAKVHGDRHPEAIQIATIFEKVMEELNSHMMKEENILFPYIRQMAVSVKQGIPLSHSPFGTVQNPINMMEHEHDVVGEMCKKIKEISGNYTPPDDGCTTYRLSFLKLQEFENDLHRHIHLENNILFPKAVQMENGVHDKG